MCVYAYCILLYLFALYKCVSVYLETYTHILYIMYTRTHILLSKHKILC